MDPQTPQESGDSRRSTTDLNYEEDNISEVELSAVNEIADEDEFVEFIDQRFLEDDEFRLSGEERIRLEVLRDLRKPCNKLEYSQKLKDAAKRLGKSVRQVRRDVKAWEEYGPASLMPSPRADKGKPRKNKSYWYGQAVKFFKAGNKGTGSLARHKVVERIEIKIYEFSKLELKDEILELERKGLSGSSLDLEVQNLIESRETGNGFQYWQEYGKPPSRRTIERWLKPLEEKMHEAKTSRSPGWHNSEPILRTRRGSELHPSHSNIVWQVDHTKADILLVDEEGFEIGRPNLTTVIDAHSTCIVGFRVGLSAPSSQVTALALRHSILPKSYGPEYKLRSQWGTYGVPKYLYTDGGKDFRSKHVIEWIADQLGFETELRARPSEGGIVERPFRTMSQLLSDVEGFVGSNILERPKDAETRACLTLAELEWLLVGYIVDSYNQKACAKTKSNPFQPEKSRIDLWKDDLLTPPVLLPIRQLDICLMKAKESTVYDNGYLRFCNLTYKAENLGAYAGSKVIIRYDPRDITMLFVYDRSDNKEKFLARAYAVKLESEKLSYEDVEIAVRKVRSKGKSINNITILEEATRRQAFINEKRKKSKTERRKIEQEKFESIPEWQKSEKKREVEDLSSDEETSESTPTEKFDYNLMREELGL